MVSTRKGGATSSKEQHSQISSKSELSAREIYNSLKIELEKFIIMIETESDIETETETMSLSIENLLEMITNNKIINNTEWTCLIRKYLEDLIILGHRNKVIEAKIQEVNINSIEISILRAMETDLSDENGITHWEESTEFDDFDDESEPSTIISKAYSNDSILSLLEGLPPPKTLSKSECDEFINSITKGSSSKKNNPDSTKPIDRITSYPIDYYISSGTISE